MKTILMTAYAVNPYKGSEEGTGWNFICQAARFNNVIAVTRKNNREDIEKYMLQNPEQYALYGRISFLYFDLPKWMITWKKGPLLSALYFYIWQLSVAVWLMRRRTRFDVGHSVNFHSNWTPTFLWLLGKPYVWGPAGNHPLIPRQYIRSFYGTKAYLKDRMLWLVKSACWYADPALYIGRKKAKKVFCVNSQAARKLRLKGDKGIFMPAVASEQPAAIPQRNSEQFTVLSAGRFVPLKGFDLAINAFSLFYERLNDEQKKKASFLIIGKGPEKDKLTGLIKERGLEHCITLQEWMPRQEIIRQFGKSSVFLFPSHEGAGMVVAEALSYGLPVVCLDNYGPGEYVHPASSLKTKQAGYQETVNSLANNLYGLFTNPDLFATEQELALARYHEIFRWDSKGDVLQEVYETICPGKATICSPASKEPRYV